jgi:DNA-binding NarL/FixJ family response regulator
MYPGRTGTEADRRAPSTRALLKDAMSPNTPLKVMLVEDHAAFRQALVFVLKSEQGLEVVAQAGSLAEAREALEGGGLPGLDVALIDLVLPDGEGTELVGELRRANPSIKVIVLSADLWPWRIDELSRAGVDAVLDKVQSPRQIAREVRREGGGG